MNIKRLTDKATAKKIGSFLTGSDAFEQQWAPNEITLVRQAPIDSLSAPAHQYWYVEADGNIVGAIGIRENKYGSGGYEMDSDYLAIHKKYRKKGLGTKLLSRAETFVKNRHGRYIHVLSCDIASYKPARAFYKKNGYRKVAHIPNYYVEGEGRIDYFKQLI